MSKSAVAELQAGNKSLLKYVPEGESPKLYLDLIKSHLFAPDKQGNPRPDEDLLLFLYTAKRSGLDPLTRQIYAIYRWDYRLGREKMAIQVSIDGMRLAAQRTGQYAGQTDAEFDSQEGSYPKWAKVTVKKVINNPATSHTGNEPLIVETTATARWTEYAVVDKNGAPTNMWAKMPYLMLGKCAEALALRKAFPNELSGLYAAEESSQANDPLADLPAPVKGGETATVNNGVGASGASNGGDFPIPTGGDLPVPNGKWLP